MSKQNMLDVDIGNSRLKWRLRCYDKNQGEVIESYGALSHVGRDDDDSLMPEFTKTIETILSGCKIDRIRVATVVKNKLLKSFEQNANDEWRIDIEIAKVKAQCAGVTQGYDDYTRLGVDRWLGVLASYNKYKKACLVVSCGTAITVDFVDGTGRHAGGYIVPGFNLMRQSLFAGTDAVKVDELILPKDILPGRNTESAVNIGLLQMVLGLIVQSSIQMSALENDFQIVLCGGDGLVVSQRLDIANAYESRLVLDGLDFALP